MYAIIKTGGKQYKVSPGDVIEVERLKAGSDGAVTLTPLLVVTDQGDAVIEATKLVDFPVSAKILGETKGGKVTVFKYRSKSGYASKNGHRQLLSLVQITSIGEAEAAELKTADDVKPETTGPQKPSPPEKTESDSEGTPVADAPDASGDDFARQPESERTPAGDASDASGEGFAGQPGSEGPPASDASGGGFAGQPEGPVQESAAGRDEAVEPDAQSQQQ